MARFGGVSGHPFSLGTIADSASTQSWAAWKVARGRPPSASEICAGVMPRASCDVLPLRRSVSTELDAIAATHPCVLKRASVMRPALRRTDRRSTSPQTGLVTSTVAVASGRSPALWGLRKCSSSVSLNMMRVYEPSVELPKWECAASSWQPRRTLSPVFGRISLTERRLAIYLWLPKPMFSCLGARGRSLNPPT